MKNIVHTLTMRHLKANLGRTIITILGIGVSIAMMTAVFIGIASFVYMDGEMILLSGGNKHASFYGITREQLKGLRGEEKLEQIGCSVIPEGEGSFQIDGTESTYRRTGDLHVGDEANLQMMMTGECEGTLPVNESEIAVDREFLEHNHLNWKIGDTVTVPLGVRYVKEEKDSPLYGDFISGELFRVARRAEFRVTAIYRDNMPTRGTKILRGMSQAEKNGTVNADVLLKKADHTSVRQLDQIVKQYNIQNYDYNNSYLETKFSWGSGPREIIYLVAVIIVMIMVASVLLIYNAFAMSLSEKVRYLGMLASVGATKRQKRNSIFFEGALLGAIGMPLGILAGIAGISVTLKLIGQKMISTGILNIPEGKMEFHVVVPGWILVMVLILGAVTIFVSSVIPAAKASAITPIDAIRQSKELRLRSKKLKTPFYIRGIFGYEGELAHKNLRRNRRKSRLIVISITLSLVLFLCVNYFCEMFMQANDMSNDLGYQVCVTVQYKDRERLYELLETMDGVDDCYAANVESITSKGLSELKENEAFFHPDNVTGKYSGLFDQKIYLALAMLEDGDFNALCDKNGLNAKDFYGGSVKGLLLNNLSHKEGDGSVFSDRMIGKTLYQIQINDEEDGGGKAEKSKAEENKWTEEIVPWVEIGGFVDYDKNNKVFGLAPKNTLNLYVPESVYRQYSQNGDMYCVAIETGQHEKVTEVLNERLEEMGFKHAYVSDYVEMMQSMNTVVFVIEVFVYGFVALITLITVANIINTVATGIHLRRKEFAMLKSVGITPAGFRKMIFLETIFYGLRALIVGIPLSLLLNYFMNRALGDSVIPFSVSVPVYLGAIAAVFLIVGGSMVYAVWKLRNDSIAGTLKEDIS